MRTTRARRALTTTAAVAALGLVLSACGGDDEPEETTEPPATSQTDPEDAESGSQDAAPSESESEAPPAETGSDAAGDDEAATGDDGGSTGFAPGTDGEDGTGGGDDAGDGPAAGESVTLAPEHAVSMAHMVPEGGVTTAEVVMLDGDTLSYLSGDVAQQEPEVEETVELDPGTGDEIRTELSALGLTAVEEGQGPPDDTTEEIYYWEAGDVMSGSLVAGSTGDLELDRAVYDILIAHVPEDIRVS
ncbi:hypothetical protein [Georgenia sp. Z1491]|uniref:hypothetical protein n=1 Tax=Georgenia sp. Z1491 TaxID=3416707 RepID=UPI003CE9FB82